MGYIFLDESGDLGFDFSKKKTSNSFVITFLFTDSKTSTEKIVKKIFQGFAKKKKKHHPGVLHANKENHETKEKVLHALSKKDVRILTIWLNKRKVYTKLQNEKQVLYNYVTNILLDRICSGKLIPVEKPIQLIASKRETNKFLNENFKVYIESQMKDRHQLQIQIDIKTQTEEKGLQVVDFASWAIYRRREFGDDRYWQIIKHKIVEENALFP